MERYKAMENLTEKNENGESKIPKSTRFSSAKVTSSKTSREKGKTQNLKRTVKLDTITSSKGKEAQNTNLPKNVRPISLAKISKDVIEHLKLDDLTTENAAPITVPNKENTTKRAQLKEKYSQKKPGNLPKKSSASDLKPSVAFGGMRLNSQKNSCQKVDMFQKQTKETKKDHEAINPPEPAKIKEAAISNKEAKTTVFPKAVRSKKTERINEENLENPPTDEAKSSKATLNSMKETVLKKCTAFGDIRFAPTWQSTPFKPDFFDNRKKESTPDNKEVIDTDPSTIWLLDTPDSAKMIAREKTETRTVAVDKTVQPTTKEDYSKTSSVILKEINYNICTAFEGMHLTPKRKSTFPLPDIFDSEQKESKSDDQELKLSGSSAEQIKMSSTTKEVIKKEILRSHVKKSEHLSVEQTRSSETVSITTKEGSRMTTFGGTRLAPKLKRTSVKPTIFDSIQKQSKTDYLESHPRDSSTKELKKIPDPSKTKIAVEPQNSDFENLRTPAMETSESPKADAKKNIKEIIPKPFLAFGGLRFKPQQRNLRDVFEAQKAKVNNQEQS